MMEPRYYPQVWTQFYSTPWVILPSKLDEIEMAMQSIVADRSFGIAPKASFGQPEEPKMLEQSDIAIIPIRGTITPRPSAFSSGGTTAERVGQNIDKAAADSSIKNIVLDIDSPGGSVFGIEETARKIRAARARKPVHAVANYIAASGAYWWGSQATTLSVAPSGTVGSVGVIYKRPDFTANMEKEGVKINTVTAGKYKDEGLPYKPMTAEEEADLKAQADTYYRKFVADIAIGRGLNAAAVEESFGQGRMVLAEEAVSRRMADRVATMEQVLDELRASGARSRRAAASRILSDVA
jgi:signal peptide peptidase SppA